MLQQTGKHSSGQMTPVNIVRLWNVNVGKPKPTAVRPEDPQTNWRCIHAHTSACLSGSRCQRSDGDHWRRLGQAQLAVQVYVLILSFVVNLRYTQCGLRGCKNWPAPFPGQEFMENECEALPGVAYPGVRDNRSTLNTKTGYDDDDDDDVVQGN